MKKNIIKILFTIAAMLATNLFAQSNEAKVFRFTSSHTSFPDTARANGHLYNNILYTAAEHYSDSSVSIVVPPNFTATKKIDIVFWFHGWGNNIDSVAVKYDITKQFIAAHKNAILVFAETTKDAPDSYGGKLEQKGTFKLLLDDILNKLKAEKIIDKKTTTGNVVLAGHSGAYRVMAYIIQNGGAAIQQAMLFDALYSEVDKYTNWLLEDSKHQFINIYTDKGGTDKVTATMMEGLTNKKIPFIHTEEKNLTTAMLQQNNIIFIHSLKSHSDVTNKPDYNFQLFLENNLVLRGMIH